MVMTWNMVSMPSLIRSVEKQESFYYKFEAISFSYGAIICFRLLLF
jgi:hypothetical protein